MAEIHDQPAGTSAPEKAVDDDFLRHLPRDGDSHCVGPVKLQARISRGGMGVIYRGRHVKLDIDVAVKFLLPHLAEDNPEYVLRFQREAKIAAQLNNENLVRVFDVDSEKNYHYVVMELVCGETARDRVARKGPLAESEALEIFLGVTRGLDAAHRKGVVHRDIKPENIMIDASGVVKLADLGIAKAIDESNRQQSVVTQPGYIMGTPSFMAPEQFMSAHAVGPACDIYSMGATLYFLLTGEPPFGGTVFQIMQDATTQEFPDVRKLRPEVSDRVVGILGKCTQREPVNRYPTATALLRDLKQDSTVRINLADSRTGTVTGMGQVSTPPARKVGEICFQVSDDEATTIAGGSRAERATRSWRGTLGMLALLCLAVCIGGGGFLLITGYVGSNTERLESGVLPSLSTAEAAAAEESDHILSVPDQPGPEVSPTEAAAGQIPEEPEPEPEPKPEPEPEPEPSTAIMQVERDDRPSALNRVQRLINEGKAGEAVAILQEAGEWAELRPQAARLHVRALLTCVPPREREALRTLETVCASHVEAGPEACELAYQEVLAYVGVAPPAESGQAAWEAKVHFLRVVPPPPESSAALKEQHAAVRTDLFRGYLSFLQDAATSSIQSNKPHEAIRLLREASSFRDRLRFEGVLSDELSRLDQLEGQANQLTVKLDRWKILYEALQKEDPSTLSALSLKERVNQLKEFLHLPPNDVHARKARELQEAYQAALAETVVPPSPPRPAQPVPAWAVPIVSRYQIDGAKKAGLPVARELDLGEGLAVEFLFVPPGSFKTGEASGREVTLTRGFYLGIHEVTREQWRAVMKADPAGTPASEEEEEQEHNLPVTHVTWDEAARFCTALSQRSSTEGSPVLVRLPTEAEWEYACRAGTQSRYPWGEEFDGQYAWYWMNSGGGVRPVGSTKPNAWGFSDLLGNTTEWCADWYGPDQPENATDPTGPAAGTERVLKGGSWRSFKGQVHPRVRSYAAPGTANAEIGFRIGMEP